MVLLFTSVLGSLFFDNIHNTIHYRKCFACIVDLVQLMWYSCQLKHSQYSIIIQLFVYLIGYWKPCFPEQIFSQKYKKQIQKSIVTHVCNKLFLFFYFLPGPCFHFHFHLNQKIIKFISNSKTHTNAHHMVNRNWRKLESSWCYFSVLHTLFAATLTSSPRVVGHVSTNAEHVAKFTKTRSRLEHIGTDKRWRQVGLLFSILA